MYLLLFLLWLVLNGRVTVEICLFGLGITALIGTAAYALFGYTPKRDLRFLLRVPLFLVYIPVLVLQILRASVGVLVAILNPKRPLKQALVVVETGLKSGFALFVLANSITLTPGTISVRSNGSRITVHCLSREMIDGVENGLLCRLLKRMEA